MTILRRFVGFKKMIIQPRCKNIQQLLSRFLYFIPGLGAILILGQNLSRIEDHIIMFEVILITGILITGFHCNSCIGGQVFAELIINEGLDIGLGRLGVPLTSHPKESRES